MLPLSSPQDLRNLLSSPPFPLDDAVLTQPLTWHRRPKSAVLHASPWCVRINGRGDNVSETLSIRGAAARSLCAWCLAVPHGSYFADAYFDALDIVLTRLDTVEADLIKATDQNGIDAAFTLARAYWANHDARSWASRTGPGRDAITETCDRNDSAINSSRTQLGTVDDVIARRCAVGDYTYHVHHDGAATSDQLNRLLWITYGNAVKAGRDPQGACRSAAEQHGDFEPTAVDAWIQDADRLVERGLTDPLRELVVVNAGRVPLDDPLGNLIAWWYAKPGPRPQWLTLTLPPVVWREFRLTRSAIHAQSLGTLEHGDDAAVIATALALHTDGVDDTLDLARTIAHG